jgi:hypothetical protein
MLRSDLLMQPVAEVLRIRRLREGVTGLNVLGGVQRPQSATTTRSEQVKSAKTPEICQHGVMPKSSGWKAE